MSASVLSPWKSPALPLKGSDRAIARLVDDIWRVHFPDVARPNDLLVGYAYPWKWRLARIRMTLDGTYSEIGVNPLLRHAAVPHEVVIAALAHEIVHYAQGFGSPLPRRQRHAHAHGAVSHELRRRGLGESERFMEAWGAEVWPGLRDALRGGADRPAPLHDARECAIVSVKAVQTRAGQGC